MSLVISGEKLLFFSLTANFIQRDDPQLSNQTGSATLFATTLMWIMD